MISHLAPGPTRKRKSPASFGEHGAGGYSTTMQISHERPSAASLKAGWEMHGRWLLARARFDPLAREAFRIHRAASGAKLRALKGAET